MAESYGWAGKLLRVDLSTGQVSHPGYGRLRAAVHRRPGRGGAIAWDELQPGVGRL